MGPSLIEAMAEDGHEPWASLESTGGGGGGGVGRDRVDGSRALSKGSRSNDELKDDGPSTQAYGPGRRERHGMRARDRSVSGVRLEGWSRDLSWEQGVGSPEKAGPWI